MNRIAPLISVILTSRNHAQFLSEAIDSVLAQSISDFELIIWDDGSTDDSWNIIERYTDPRIIRHRNLTNQRAVLNRAIPLARGRYIAIHHSDDVWEPHKLATQLRVLEQHQEIGAVFSWVSLMDERGASFEIPNHFYSRIFEQPNRTRFQWLNYFFYHGNALCHPSLLIRRECYDQCGYYRQGLAQLPDFDMWIRLCFHWEIHILPERLVRFRIRDQEANASGNRPENQNRMATELYFLARHYLRLSTLEELRAVFPEIDKWIQDSVFDPRFVLGILAVQEQTLPPIKLFGLDLLFDIFGDPSRLDKIKKAYGFGPLDLIDLTGITEIFLYNMGFRKKDLEELQRKVLSLESELMKRNAVQDEVPGLPTPEVMARPRVSNNRPSLRQYAGKLLRLWGLRQYPVTPSSSLPPASIDIISSGFYAERATLLWCTDQSFSSWDEVGRQSWILALMKRWNVVVWSWSSQEALLGEGLSGLGWVMLHGSSAAPADLKIYAQCLAKKLPNVLVILDNQLNRPWAQALTEVGLATLSVVDDFDSDRHFPAGLRATCLWSTRTFFATTVMRDVARSYMPYLTAAAVAVVPRGRSFVRHDRGRPALWSQKLGDDREFLVLGSGPLCFSAGVDLFVACAAVLHKRKPGRFKFVWWFDEGHPNSDSRYAAYLLDQIERMGVATCLVYRARPREANGASGVSLFLSTQRAGRVSDDTLQALTGGIPIVCFDKTTELPELFEQAQLTTHCVVPFLNIEAMADRVMDFSMSPTLCREVAKSGCDGVMESYLSHEVFLTAMEQQHSDLLAQAAQRHRDFETIVESGLFGDGTLVTGENITSMREQVFHYLQTTRNGIDSVKPCPGFHPGVYQEQAILLEPCADSFAEYIRRGRPVGPWAPSLIVPDSSCQNRPSPAKVALHLHVFYPALLRPVWERLAYNLCRPDLWISVPSEEHARQVRSEAGVFADCIKEVRVVPNRGRDIGPLLTAFGPELVAQYEVIGHIYTKVSPHADPEVGHRWYHFLLENLLGSKDYPMMDIILARFKDQTDLGLVFPDFSRPVGWDRNRAIAEHWAQQLGIKELPTHFDFPVGTMFWARAEKLRPLVELKLLWTDYPHEPLPNDGTVLHAFERLIPFIPAPTCQAFAMTSVR